MPRRTKEDAEKTKQELIASALKLFSEKGVSRTTLTDIANGAGVTKGAFYWHFKNKFEILNVLRVQYMAEIDAVSDIDIESPEFNINDFLGQFNSILDLIESSADFRAFYRICMLKCEFTDELSEFVELDIIETKKWKVELEVALNHLPDSAWQSNQLKECELLSNVICDYLSGYLLGKSMENVNISKQEALRALKLICRGGGLII